MYIAYSVHITAQCQMGQARFPIPVLGPMCSFSFLFLFLTKVVELTYIVQYLKRIIEEEAGNLLRRRGV